MLPLTPGHCAGSSLRATGPALLPINGMTARSSLAVSRPGGPQRPLKCDPRSKPHIAPGKGRKVLQEAGVASSLGIQEIVE